ncbi:MAG TPA: hypothetical protein VJ691_03840 [Vicinamibacterales bacterium]|nr:hypothetical protein [Vicinamibacterales bacterium]
MTRLSRPTRRIVVAIVALVILDLIEPGVLRRLEATRYEDRSKDFRFENSDLFGVGPLVEYLRDNPAGRQPRVVFIGNSVTYGYGLSAAEALPGQYQRLDRSGKVLNVGVNGLDIGSAYLVAKATIGSVDHFYVLCRADPVPTPLIGRHIPVDEGDARQLGLPPVDSLETALRRGAERWALYRDSYRLQAALFGTSSRQFVYLHKGELARTVLSTVRAQARGGSLPVEVTALAPVATTMPADQRLAAMRAASPPMLWMFAELFRDSGKQLVLLQLRGFAEWLRDESSVADFNRAHFPHARIVMLEIPLTLRSDDLHLTAAGAAAAARALWRERDAFEDRAR